MMRRTLFFMIFTLQMLVAFGQSVHTVKEGETLESIARQHHITTNELKKANENAEMLFPGLLLNIPQVQRKAEAKSAASKTEIKTDIVRMRDGSYILCKVIGMKKSMLSIQQDGIDKTISVAIREVSEINYANGKKRKF